MSSEINTCDTYLKVVKEFGDPKGILDPYCGGKFSEDIIIPLIINRTKMDTVPVVL